MPAKLRFFAQCCFAGLLFAAFSATAPASTELSIKKTAPSLVRDGDHITYTVTVENVSSFTAEQVQITDPLPPQISESASVTAGGWECFREQDTIICSLNALPPGESQAVLIDAHVNAGSAEQIVNTASVSTMTPEVNPLDNEASALTFIRREDSADLSLSAVSIPESVRPSSLVTYEVRIANIGPGIARNTTVTVLVDPAVHLLSAESLSGPCTQNGDSVTCNLGDVPAGETAPASVKVRTGKTRGTVRTTFNCDSESSDPNIEDNDAEVPTEVTPKAPASYSCCETNISLDSTVKGLQRRSIRTHTGFIGNDGIPDLSQPYDTPGQRSMWVYFNVPISWTCGNLPGASCIGTFDVEFLKEPGQAAADGQFTVGPVFTEHLKNYRRRRCIAGRTYFAVIQVIYHAKFPTNGPIQGPLEFRITVPEGKGPLDHKVSTSLSMGEKNGAPSLEATPIEIE